MHTGMCLKSGRDARRSLMYRAYALSSLCCIHVSFKTNGSRSCFLAGEDETAVTWGTEMGAGIFSTAFWGVGEEGLLSGSEKILASITGTGAIGGRS